MLCWHRLTFLVQDNCSPKATKYCRMSSPGNISKAMLPGGVSKINLENDT